MSKRLDMLERLLELKELEKFEELLKKKEAPKPGQPGGPPKRWHQETWKVWLLLFIMYPILAPSWLYLIKQSITVMYGIVR